MVRIIALTGLFAVGTAVSFSLVEPDPEFGGDGSPYFLLTVMALTGILVIKSSRDGRPERMTALQIPD